MSNSNLAENLLDDMLGDFDGLDFGELETQTAAKVSGGSLPTSKVVDFNNIKVDASQIGSLAQTGAQKLKMIEAELNNLFVERDAVIKDSIRALSIGQSQFLLGPPGTGKSAMISELCNRIDSAQYFSWLLNRTSDPAEILGPFSIKAMERDKFLRKTEGKLPCAHIAFLDEVWKCNEPTLNILLPLINEKIFYNDGQAIPVPLISLFAASNELPEDEALNALYDRLIFRHYVDYIADAANKQKMYEGYLDKRNGVLLNSVTKITLEELKAVQEKTKTVTVDKNILKNFIKLISTLNKEGITVSDRRQNECLKVMQGNAVLEDRDVVVLDDLVALTYVLWENKDDISIIEREITKLINPFDDKVRDLMRKYKEIKDNLDSIKDSNDKCRASIEAKGSLESIVGKIDNVIKDARKNGKDITTFNERRDEIVQFNQQLMKEALGIKLFDDSDNSPF